MTPNDMLKARQRAQSQKAKGYLEVKTTRTLRLVPPLTDRIDLMASYGWDFPEGSLRNAIAWAPLPKEGKPTCVLVGRNPLRKEPSFYETKEAIDTFIRTAIVFYERADEGMQDARLPVILTKLGTALAAAGLPPITSDAHPIDRIALLPSSVISRLAGLLIFRQEKGGIYCSVTNTSLNEVHVATNPSFVDFSSIGFVSIRNSWQA